MPKLLRVESCKQDGNLSLHHGSEEVVIQKREEFLLRHGVRAADCVYLQAAHGDGVTHVGAAERGAAIATEALITKDRGVFLFLLTADCFPVSFYDTAKHVIALAHMGWKPTDKELAAKVVKEMRDTHGSNPEDVQIFIGPGIHKESYSQVDPLQKRAPKWAPYLRDLQNGETEIDLVGYIKAQLTGSGVLEANIEVSPINTATADEYFSHYRSLRTGEPEGRFATVLGLV